jgi:putative transposase
VALQAIAQAYAAEKNDHLWAFGDDLTFATYEAQEQCRDALLDAQYANAHGLQARMWKMALKDAYETVLRTWAALAEDLRSRVSGQKAWTVQQKHYANWLLKREQRLAQLAAARAPVAEHIVLSIKQRKVVQNYLRRQIRLRRGQRSRVKLVRSFALDRNMYSLFENKSTQYIRVMNLQGQDRVLIPLTGQQVIAGNIRVVLDPERCRVEVHYTAAVDVHCPLTGEAAGLDAGLSEVFTDEQGHRYGTDFGQTLVKHSDQVCDKGRKRNKLHQLEKKARAAGKLDKANHIRRFNLGTAKQRRQRQKMQIEIERQVNTALNQVLDKRQPAQIITEKLDIRGSAPSKQLSRRVSLWARSTLTDRTEFKASSGGSCRQHVNPAYSSQTCPQCGFVHRRNRNGDKFQCQYCRHGDDADRVAALNLKARASDPHITLFTPAARVKAILLDRFNARLREAEGESPKPANVQLGQLKRSRSVSGKTPGTRRHKPKSQPESETTVAIRPRAGENYRAKG